MAYSRHGRATNRPAEAGSELRPFVALHPGLIGAGPRSFVPGGQHGPGTTAEKGNEIKAARMRGGGLEPASPAEKPQDSHGETGRNGQERARGGPPGSTSDKRRF